MSGLHSIAKNFALPQRKAANKGYGPSRFWGQAANANINWSLFGTPKCCPDIPPNPLPDWANGRPPIEGERCQHGKCATGLDCVSGCCCYTLRSAREYDSCAHTRCGGGLYCDKSYGAPGNRGRCV